MSASEEPLFGVVVPGRVVITQAQQIEERKFVVDIENPGSVPDLCVFLLPAAQAAFPPPAGGGAAIYFTEDGSNWQYLGSLSWTRTSDTFRTGFPSHPTVSTAAAVRLGVSFEPTETLQEIEAQNQEAKAGFDERLAVAKAVAQDLFNYCESFTSSAPRGGAAAAAAAAAGGGGGGLAGNMGQLGLAADKLVLPNDVLDRWLKRFEQKYARDPNFFFKTTR